jgi:hypothetical protein
VGRQGLRTRKFLGGGCATLTSQVYCGECAVYRFKTKRRGLAKTPRGGVFSECVVEGCKSKTPNKAMIQLYI